MTNLAAITEDLQPYPVRQSLIVRQCEKHSLAATEAVSDEKKIAIIVVEILSQMVMLNNVSEGGVSISFNKEEVNTFIKRKCVEAGIDSTTYIKQATVERLE